AGTKRRVKAGPTSRGRPGFSGRAPRIQTFRRPFFRSTVVMVAVVILDRVLMASGVMDIEKARSGRGNWRSASCGAAFPRQGRDKHDELSEKHGERAFVSHAPSTAPPVAEWRPRH